MPDIVDANTAYQGASGELVGRIQARDQILLAYVAAAAALFSILATKSGISKAAIVIPYFGFVTTLMIVHHDFIIMRLADFLRELEQTSGAESLHWHSHSRYGETLWARMMFNVAHLFSLILTAPPSLWIVWQSLYDPSKPGWTVRWKIAVISALVLFGVSCFAALAVGIARLKGRATVAKTKKPENA